MLVEILKKAPPWLIGTGLIAIFVLLLMSVESGKTFGVRVEQGRYIMGFFAPDADQTSCTEPEPWYGYFKDIERESGRTVLVKEDLTLIYCGDHFVVGKSGGEVPTPSGFEKRAWRYRGFALD